MHNEFDIIFGLVLGFFVETIILLVVLIRLDQRREPNQPVTARKTLHPGNSCLSPATWLVLRRGDAVAPAGLGAGVADSDDVVDRDAGHDDGERHDYACHSG